MSVVAVCVVSVAGETPLVFGNQEAVEDEAQQITRAMQVHRSRTRTGCV